MSDQNISTPAAKPAAGGANPNAVGPRAGTAAAKPRSTIVMGAPGSGTTTLAMVLCMADRRSPPRTLIRPRSAAPPRMPEASGAPAVEAVADVEGAIEALSEGGAVADLDLDAGRTFVALAARVKLSRYVASGLQAIVVVGAPGSSARQARPIIDGLRHDAADAGIDGLGVVFVDAFAATRAFTSADHVALKAMLAAQKIPSIGVEPTELCWAERLGFDILMNAEAKEVAERLKMSPLKADLHQASFRQWVTKTQNALRRLTDNGGAGST